MAIEATTVRRRFLWVLIVLLAGGLVLMMTRQREDTIASLTQPDFAMLLYQVGLIVLVGALVLTLFREKLAQALEAALLWIAIALVLVMGYTYRVELRDVGDRVLMELVPGRASTFGKTVEISRGRGGSFPVHTHVNGVQVAMVLDTGASAVVLTQEAAKAVGLPVEVLTYSVPVDTANGRTRAAPVTLDRIAVGSIVERGVAALIAQPGQLRTSLLGMTFLDRLERWEVRGDKLVLRSR
jgi:aspartyl protease family protein